MMCMCDVTLSVYPHRASLKNHIFNLIAKLSPDQLMTTNFLKARLLFAVIYYIYFNFSFTNTHTPVI